MTDDTFIVRDRLQNMLTFYISTHFHSGEDNRNSCSRSNEIKYEKSLTPQAFDKVDWNGLESTRNIMGTQYRLWAIKHVSGFCVTNKMLSYRTPSHTTKCPCCKAVVVEDSRHQVHYTDPQRISLWKDSIQDVNTWLSENNTEPELQTTIIYYLRYRGTMSFLDSRPRYLPISTSQDKIGW